MNSRWLPAVALVPLLAFPFLTRVSAADKGIAFIGMGKVSGAILDRSGLEGQNICQLGNETNCIDMATLGGFGSALTYTGHDNVFLAASDRGPFDGRTTVPYPDRVHFLHITVDPDAPFPNIQTVLLDTLLLKRRGPRSFVGDSSAFDLANPRGTLRFDPEGIRVGKDGTFYVSDEYGPYIYNFDRDGHLVERIDVPAKFAIAKPTGDVDTAGNSLELYPDYNLSGRQANRGMEGLAITPDGRTLVGIMQNALIQDHGLNDSVPPGRLGLNNRILTIDLKNGKTHEYVYVLDGISQGRGVNEILAVNDHEFLVLERDNRSKVPTPPNEVQTPNMKRIYLINLHESGLTDVSDWPSLPATAEELGSIKPVTKTLFLDLLDPDYKVDATQTIKDVIAEKIEGLAWGPDLPDGRHVLYVISDNDLFPGLPTQIYAFAVDSSAAGANVDFDRQRLPDPLFPPGQVKKILKQNK